MKTTAVRIHHAVRAQASCPVCSKHLVIHYTLSEEELRTVTPTIVATRLTSQLEAEKARRGWSGDACGSCRDSDQPGNPVGAVEIEGLSKGLESKEPEADCG